MFTAWVVFTVTVYVEADPMAIVASSAAPGTPLGDQRLAFVQLSLPAKFQL